ncbi:MAG: hypothetical protein JNM93_08965 [Bacteriovoracaceae bacterium]|nr:hypothetical protein [Bacteriovoracaceae bacterium]
MGKILLPHIILSLTLLVSCGARDLISTAVQGFAVTTLTDDAVPTQSKTWNWSCNSVSGGNCHYRYAINTSSTHTFTVEPYVLASTTANQPNGDDIYYLHVQVWDDLSLNESGVTSVSAILDNTAPTDPTGGAVALAYTGTTSSPNITWTASTDLNGVDHYETALGTSPGASDVVAWATNGAVLTEQFTGVAFSEGVTYYPSIRAHDVATNVSGVHSNFGSFCYDVSAPTLPSNLILTGTAFLTNSPQLSWDASTDACSGLLRYEVSLSTTIGGSNIITWTNVGTALNHQFITITPWLQQGVTYYMNVRARDNLNLVTTAVTSSSFMLPDAVNVTGLVADLVPTKVKNWTWSCDSLPCTYRYVINTSAAFTFTNQAFGATTNASQATGNGNYYIHVQAQNAGNVSPTVHIQARLDNTNPTTPGVIALGATYTTNNTQSPSFTWGASTDANGVTDYQIGIGTTVGGTQTLAWTSDGADTSATATGLTLVEGQNYYATVRASDQATNTSTARNSSAFCYDNSAPNNISGFTISSASVSTATSPTHTWSATTDACSGLNHYEMAIGTSAGGTDVVAWTNIGTVTSRQMSGLSLSLGTDYYTSLRAHDNAGFISNVVTSSAWQVTEPTITNMSAPANGDYILGNNLNFTATFSVAVNVTGSPRIPITLDSGTVYATYLSGSGSTNLIFRYTATALDSDSDGIVMVSPLELNGGTIRNAALINAILTYSAPSTSGITVNLTPVITLSWDETAWDYGSPGVDVTKTFTLTNNGNATSGVLTINATNADFKFVVDGPSDNCSGTTLAPLANCTVGITYQWILPSGTDIGSATADDGGGNTDSINLQGTR